MLKFSFKNITIKLYALLGSFLISTRCFFSEPLYCYAAEESSSGDFSSSNGNFGWVPFLLALSFIFFIELIQIKKKLNMESPELKN